MEVGVLNFEHLKHDTSRKIIHIDMDAFYASVEMRDRPDLKDKPIIMAEHPKLTGGRGVVSTCNYKAREFGVRAAMSAQKAFELCPNGVFLPVNIDYYASISKQIRAIFLRYTNSVEPLSLDEAFLDVTTNKLNAKSAMYIAKCIQRDIWNELHLTCSAGVSYNKFLAKIASDYQKPAGLTTIIPDDAITFIKQLPIEKFFGVGKKSVEKLHACGIFKGEDIYTYNSTLLVEQFGRLGFLLLQRSRGIDNSIVQPYRKQKSIGRERTFYPELHHETDITIAIRQQAIEVSKLLQKANKKGNVITLKLRSVHFETMTRQRKIDFYTNDEHVIFQEAMLLWEQFGDEMAFIRLLGVSVSGIDSVVKEAIRLEL